MCLVCACIVSRLHFCRRLSRVNSAFRPKADNRPSTNWVSKREQALQQQWVAAWEDKEKNHFSGLVLAAKTGRPFEYTMVGVIPMHHAHRMTCITVVFVCSAAMISPVRSFIQLGCIPCHLEQLFVMLCRLVNHGLCLNACVPRYSQFRANNTGCMCWQFNSLAC